MNTTHGADFLIITPLPEERDAILIALPNTQKLPPDGTDIRTYYVARVPVTLNDGARSEYLVAVVAPVQMGQTDATAVTLDAIRRWSPRYVILTGIAGGMTRSHVSLGDILVAEQVVEYERAKQTTAGDEIRWRTHEVDQRLLAAAKGFTDPQWMTTPALRPDRSKPTVHFGPICTGDKIVADARVLRTYSEIWPKLIGIEMEGGGVATAVAQTAAPMPGFFMVRGVSDLADDQKDTEHVRQWREHACSIAASYVAAFIRSMPVPVVGVVDGRKVDVHSDKLSETLAVELRLLDSWSSTIDILGMPHPKAMQDVYVELAMTDDPRAQRFGSLPQRTRFTTDEALERSGRRMVILGDPGAGKTTTLKKITRRLLALRATGERVLPIVVRLREFRKDDSLVAHLADVASFAVYDRERHELPLAWSPEKTHRATVRLVAQILSGAGAFLLIDGLDELHPDGRDMVLDEINLLASSGFSGGVVLTSRSATFTRKPDGFAVFEIEPLQASQQNEFVAHWFQSANNRLRTADAFETELAAVPYKDLRNRPLTLANLCIVFEKYGYLPPSPVTIYRKIVQLLLEEWDGERGVTRHSRYAGFDAARKLDFLAALSYEMDVVRGTGASFSSSNLKDAYRTICDRFHLPPDDAATVATEIESHSGLIVKTGIETFEFSHKSLQEYLTAEYISRLRLLPPLATLLHEYPNELAIAVALASDPVDWFCSLFLVEGGKGRLRKMNAPVAPFLARLALERPTFGVSRDLGFTILWLISKWPAGDEAMAFCEMENIGASLAAYFSVCGENRPRADRFGRLNDHVTFHPDPKAEGRFGHYWDISVPVDVAERLLQLVRQTSRATV